MVQEGVCELVEDVHLSQGFLLTLNTTFITLIPKEEGATHLKKFWPIVLCNIIYKLITKVMALRIKPILPFSISKEKYGYVEG
jgi:hypothetical protein